MRLEAVTSSSAHNSNVLLDFDFLRRTFSRITILVFTVILCLFFGHWILTAWRWSSESNSFGKSSIKRCLHCFDRIWCIVLGFIGDATGARYWAFFQSAALIMEQAAALMIVAWPDNSIFHSCYRSVLSCCQQSWAVLHGAVVYLQFSSRQCRFHSQIWFDYVGKRVRILCWSDSKKFLELWQFNCLSIKKEWNLV